MANSAASRLFPIPPAPVTNLIDTGTPLCAHRSSSASSADRPEKAEHCPCQLKSARTEGESWSSCQGTVKGHNVGGASGPAPIPTRDAVPMTEGPSPRSTLTRLKFSNTLTLFRQKPSPIIGGPAGLVNVDHPANPEGQSAGDRGAQTVTAARV